MAIWFSENMWFHDEMERDLYAAIGIYQTTWAGMDVSLAVLVQSIWDWIGGQILEIERPRALKRRVTYLRRAAKLTSFNDNDRECIKQLCDLLHEEMDFRHHLTHGANVQYLKNSTQLAMKRSPGIQEHPLDGFIKIIHKDDVVRHHDALQEIFIRLIFLHDRLHTLSISRGSAS